jgi:hypothetical protein
MVFDAGGFWPSAVCSPCFLDRSSIPPRKSRLEGRQKNRAPPTDPSARGPLLLRPPIPPVIPNLKLRIGRRADQGPPDKSRLTGSLRALRTTGDRQAIPAVRVAVRAASRVVKPQRPRNRPIGGPARRGGHTGKLPPGHPLTPRRPTESPEPGGRPTPRPARDRIRDRPARPTSNRRPEGRPINRHTGPPPTPGGRWGTIEPPRRRATGLPNHRDWPGITGP